MKVIRTIPVLLYAVASLSACQGPSKKELELVNTRRADSLSTMRNELLDQMIIGTGFVTEINHELSKARSLGSPGKQLQPSAELTDASEERKQVVARIIQLVSRLNEVTSRLALARSQMIEKDSTFAAKIAAYELTVAEVNQAAEKQRIELQSVIDAQTIKIASLTKSVDTLTGVVSHLTTDQNAVYFVVGTRAELLKKGVLVAEGAKRFLVAGSRTLVPSRELDPGVFTKLDRLTDSTIFLPVGEYKIVSRQNAAYTTPSSLKGGRILGALKIEQPERFWSTSRFLIIVRA